MKAGWLVALLAVLALAGAGGAVYMGTRGIRNNNPGNIRKSRDRWLGMSDRQTDAEFVQFEKPEYGVRALAIVLKNYMNKHNLRTIRSIVTRWAPPIENDTASYIESVVKQTGIGADVMLSPTADVLTALAKAITTHENGRVALATDGRFTDAVFAHGVRLALS